MASRIFWVCQGGLHWGNKGDSSSSGVVGGRSLTPVLGYQRPWIQSLGYRVPKKCWVYIYTYIYVYSIHSVKYVHMWANIYMYTINTNTCTLQTYIYACCGAICRSVWQRVDDASVLGTTQQMSWRRQPLLRLDSAQTRTPNSLTEKKRMLRKATERTS